jgi:hypothetical protein
MKLQILQALNRSTLKFDCVYTRRELPRHVEIKLDGHIHAQACPMCNLRFSRKLKSFESAAVVPNFKKSPGARHQSVYRKSLLEGKLTLMGTRFLKLPDSIAFPFGKGQVKMIFVNGKNRDGWDFLMVLETEINLLFQSYPGAHLGEGVVFRFTKINQSLLLVGQDGRRLVTEVFHGYLLETIDWLFGILVNNFIFRKKPMQDIKATTSCEGHLISF